MKRQFWEIISDVAAHFGLPKIYDWASSRLSDERLVAIVGAEEVDRRREARRHIYDEISAERVRQDVKFPDCYSLPDGTGGDGWKTWEQRARAACDQAARDGRLTHAHVLDEESSEALAAEDPAALRKELIQVAAVAVAWIEDIDRRMTEDPLS